MQPQEQHPQMYSAPVKPQLVDQGASASPPSSAPFNSGQVFLFTGIFMLGTLVMIPVWNSVALLSDATFIYMSGSLQPTLIIVACVSVCVMYAVTVAIFFRTSRMEVQTEQSILMIGSLFLALLGVLLLLLSTPLHRSADEGYQGIWNNCQFGAPRGLYDSSQALHALRATPGCRSMQSIEECQHYQPTEAALTLKAMEAGFRCSGFCYQPLPAGNASASSEAAPPSPEEASMMQTQSRTVRAAAHGGQQGLAEAVERQHRARQEPRAPPAFAPYPPTLFSQANFQASCDGMAARNMRNFAGDVADQTFYEGVMLVIVSIIIGFLKLLGFCGHRREEPHFIQKQVQRSSSQGYGSEPPQVRQRRISRDELGLH